jgi:ABC-type enterochelin transport system permease subunit
MVRHLSKWVHSTLAKVLIPDYSFLWVIQKLRCIKLETAKYFVKQSFEKLEMVSV